MSRPNTHRTLRLERLESREVLTGGGPSALQQYTLELLNQARTNPAATAQWVSSHLDASETATLKYYGVNLQNALQTISSATAQPPLAWNDLLAQAAQAHSQDMVDNHFQSHTGSDGSSPNQRLDQVGYTPRASSGENAYAYATSVDDAMEAFLLDWGVSSHGHFDNIMQPGVAAQDANREVGVGIVQTDKSGIGPMVMTQDFGSLVGAKAELLGVAYDDPNLTHFYAPGEGRGDVTITAVNDQTGKTTHVQTWDSGGYQMTLDPGTYEVTATVGNQVVRTQKVTIGNVNVKVDYDLSDAWQSSAKPPASGSTRNSVTNLSAIAPPSSGTNPGGNANPAKGANGASSTTGAGASSQTTGVHQGAGSGQTSSSSQFSNISQVTEPDSTSPSSILDDGFHQHLDVTTNSSWHLIWSPWKS